MARPSAPAPPRDQLRVADEPGDSGFGWPRIPQVGVGEAMARHPFIALIPVLIGLVLGVAAAEKRHPTYSAQTRMRVTGLTLNGPGSLPGLSTASASLATAAALSVGADGVILPVAAQLHLPIVQVRQAVNATPIADSPMFFIAAESKNALRTRQIANSVADSLAAYMNRSNRRPPEAILADYKTSEAQVQDLTLKVTQAKQAYSQSRTRANAAALTKARTDLQAASLQASTLQAAYRSSLENANPNPRVRVLQRASTAKSDRGSKLQIFGFAGVVLGLLAGAALATFVANRSVRRLALSSR
jgi:uncharacterized protein involved in exopolysaccharide biosynthesis